MEKKHDAKTVAKYKAFVYWAPVLGLMANGGVYGIIQRDEFFANEFCLGTSFFCAFLIFGMISAKKYAGILVENGEIKKSKSIRRVIWLEKILVVLLIALMILFFWVQHEQMKRKARQQKKANSTSIYNHFELAEMATPYEAASQFRF
ncbi:MAG: hypothetical protein JEZ07_00840 [Phycisphaerae bacterium]|nr:hypothetical protein [Phycisphaerae bacterium]